jgi:hypothetical protein
MRLVAIPGDEDIEPCFDHVIANEINDIGLVIYN